MLVLEYLLPLGSCVHMTPVYEALRRARPEMTITVATRGLGLAVLRHSPFVDHLFETPDPFAAVGATVRSLRAQLRERGLAPGCCLTGCPDQRTRIALLALLACAGWRGGYTLEPSLYQRPLRVDPLASQIANNLRLAKGFGYAGELIEPRVFYTEADATEARGLLAELHGRGQPVLCVVTQNSGGQRTGWHDERWVAALQQAHRELGFGLAFLGTEADAAKIAALREAVGAGVSLAGRTTIGQLAAVLALGDLAVSLDTGTMHLGRAVGVPMVVLGPSWQRPTEWLPVGKAHIRILRGADRVGVPKGYRLDEITVGDVTAALAELAGLYPASEGAREARLAAGISAIDLLAGGG